MSKYYSRTGFTSKMNSLGYTVSDEDYKEYAILVGRESQESLEELKELASACDIETVHIMLQKGSRIDKSLGSQNWKGLIIFILMNDKQNLQNLPMMDLLHPLAAKHLLF